MISYRCSLMLSLVAMAAACEPGAMLLEGEEGASATHFDGGVGDLGAGTVSSNSAAATAVPTGDICSRPIARAVHKFGPASFGPLDYDAAVTACNVACEIADRQLDAKCDAALGCCRRETVRREARAVPRRGLPTVNWECTCEMQGFGWEPDCPSGMSWNEVLDQCTCDADNAVNRGNSCHSCGAGAFKALESCVCDNPDQRYDYTQGRCECPEGQIPDGQSCVAVPPSGGGSNPGGGGGGGDDDAPPSGGNPGGGDDGGDDDGGGGGGGNIECVAWVCVEFNGSELCGCEEFDE